ncbi:MULTISPECIES: YusW family protein [Sporosarcina]|uniref:YusW family protein n=1 Tax=Sporosarcina TaxID=1569 RepID=UPI001FD379D4|nr:MULTISPECIES: YusW family protein [Sporosarcina]WJY29019.1 YusW family protein [Sporosarcina sp. 0.2-SM1T-5]
MMTVGTALFAGVLFTGGCGNFSKDADKDNRDEADIVTTDEKEGGDRDTGDGYGFNVFDLEIDVNGEDAVDAEYKVEKDFDPEYQNEQNNIDLKGQEAMDELDKLFIDTNLESNMSGEEARDKILDYYQIDEYSKFDLNVEFDDGKKLNFQDEK